MIRDYYAVLDLEIDADYALIKQRYRQLVRENHPDIAADKEAAHARMQLILEAWKVLSDPSRRARYDNELATHRGTSKKEMAPSGTYTSNATANTQVWETRTPPPADRQRSSGQPRPSYGAPRASQNPRTKLLTMVFEAAQLYHKDGRVNEAISVCNRVMKADPTNVDAVVLLGDIYADQKRKDIALTMYERAMRLQPNNALYRQKWNQLRHGAATGGGPGPEAASRPAAAPNAQTVHSAFFNPGGPKRPGLNERLAGAEVTPPPLRRQPGTASTETPASPEPPANSVEDVAAPLIKDETRPVAAAEPVSASEPDLADEPAAPTDLPDPAPPGETEPEDSSSGSLLGRFKARLKR